MGPIVENGWFFFDRFGSVRQRALYSPASQNESEPGCPAKWILHYKILKHPYITPHSMEDKLDLGAEIDLLEYEMDRIIEQKDKAVQRIQAKIDDAEEKAHRIRKRLEWFEGQLTQLRQDREREETESYREIVQLHKRIQNIKTRHV